MPGRNYLTGAVLVALAVTAPPARSQSDNAGAISRMKKDIFFLASDETEGRGPGTKGIDLAADYIAKTFADIGLKPAGVKGTYYQPFEIGGDAVLEQPNTLAFIDPKGDKTDVPVDTKFQVMGLSGKGNVSAPLVFAGYGIESKKNKYDDYEGIDIAGKVVIVLRHSPRYFAKEPFGGDDRNSLAALERKIATAESHKAAAVILVNDIGEAKTGDKLMPFKFLEQASTSRIPCIQVLRSAIDPVFLRAVGKSLEAVEKEIDKDLKPQSLELKGWSAAIQTSVRRSMIEVKNILGIVPGTGPLGNEYVVVGAHYDHLGYGGRGSRAPGSKEIHHGADDNGSGTTAVVELARRFAARKDRTGRSILFMTFSGEERGLLGSKYYTEHPLIPLADSAAMVNLDMVGRLRPDPDTKKDKLIAQGTGTSKEFGALIDKLNKQDFTFSKIPAGTGPSDHDSFYRKKVPVLFFWTGIHPDYHKPTDTADKIDLPGMARIVDFTEGVIEKLVTEKERPVYVEVKGGTPSSGAGDGPRLGIVPNYESDKEGLTIDGVADGGPAAKAGMKAGDRIIEMAGRDVKDIQTYMAVMATRRIGETFDATVIRDGKKLTLKVTP
jgi:Peptidase family M28/PDZ domain/PA domain